MQFLPDSPQANREDDSSGVSWGAVIGGAVVVAAFCLILLVGLSAISPWSNGGFSASAAGIATIAWLVLTEVIASAFGGYLTGRLRTKWALIHTDEVYFRDTANGFLAWAVALVISVTFLAGAATSMSGGAQRRALGESTAASTNAGDPSLYFIDILFRSDHPSAEAKDAVTQAEAARIFARALRQNRVSPPDQNYLAGLIAAKAGIDQTEAEKRISDAFVEAHTAEDAARKVTARLLLWSFLALMMGAFVACYAATIGGRQRDRVKSA
jgi:hypothetical protein